MKPKRPTELGVGHSLSPEGGGGWGNFRGSHGFQGERRGDLSWSTEYKEGTIDNCLPINCPRQGIIRILQSLIGGSHKFDRDTTRLLRNPSGDKQ